MKTRLCSVLITMLILGLSFQNAHAQFINLNIQKWDNSERNVELNSIKKITFSDVDLILNFLTNDSENIAKSNIQKLFFSKTTGMRNIISESKALLVYPNPANDFITLKNIPEGVFTAEIYSITGSKIKNTSISSNAPQINVSDLSKGLYFLKVNNQATKFTKQ